MLALAQPLDDAGTLIVYVVAASTIVGAVARYFLTIGRKVAKEQDERMTDRVGERVAAEMAPVVKQVDEYAKDVKAALSEFRAGERRQSSELLSVWKAFGRLGVTRHEVDSDD